MVKIFLKSGIRRLEWRIEIAEQMKEGDQEDLLSVILRRHHTTCRWWTSQTEVEGSKIETKWKQTW